MDKFLNNTILILLNNRLKSLRNTGAILFVAAVLVFVFNSKADANEHLLFYNSGSAGSVEIKELPEMFLPENPHPEDGSGGVNLDVDLVWEGLADEERELHYLVYFGSTSEMGLLAATWPYEGDTFFSINQAKLEPNSEYFWQVVARDKEGSEIKGPIWTFNTFGAIAGVLSGSPDALEEREIVVFSNEGSQEWIEFERVAIDYNGEFKVQNLPEGQYLVGLDSKDFWYPEIIRVSGGQMVTIEIDINAYDFGILLNEGWNLLSLPRWIEDDGIFFPEPIEDYIGSWMTYWEGEWIQDDAVMSIEEALNNPLRAVYINILQPTVIHFKWKEINAELKFASQTLYPGWNLISTSYEEDYRLVLAGLSDLGNGGITHISAPNSVNILKGFNYSNPWETPVVSMFTPGRGKKPIMYPLDGYWVHLSGEPLVYSAMVSVKNPSRKITD